MYAQMPIELKSQIDSLLNTDQFTKAKLIYDQWHDYSDNTKHKSTYTEQIKRLLNGVKKLNGK